MFHINCECFAAQPFPLPGCIISILDYARAKAFPVSATTGSGPAALLFAEDHAALPGWGWARFCKTVLNCLAALEAALAEMEKQPGRFGGKNGQAEERGLAQFRVLIKYSDKRLGQPQPGPQRVVTLAEFLKTGGIVRQFNLQR